MLFSKQNLFHTANQCHVMVLNGLNSVEIQERLSLASQLSFVGKNKTKTKNKQKKKTKKPKTNKQTNKNKP